MKLLHTADWHAGRQLKGVDRTPEIAEALEELAELAAYEAVDLVLVSGDIFDKKQPSPQAEACVYRFFHRLAEAGIPSVVVAGNHDSSQRLEAHKDILALARARVFGEPRVSSDGGVFWLELAKERVCIAALPFISERRLLRFEALIENNAGQWLSNYRKGMRAMVNNLCQAFSPDSVNLLLMHTTMEAAELSHSEYRFHCTEAYTLPADIVPDSCNYAALGHIHRAQSIQGLAENSARYSGSLIQLDFGEAGDHKYAYIVEARAGKPSQLVREYRIQAGEPLHQVHIDLAREELEPALFKLSDLGGWLKLRLSMERPIPGLKDRIKEQLPRVLAVELNLPEQRQEAREQLALEQLHIPESFERYYEEMKMQAIPADVKAAFNALYQAYYDRS